MLNLLNKKTMALKLVSKKRLKKKSKPFKHPYSTPHKYATTMRFTVKKVDKDGKIYMGYEELPVLVFG